MLETQIRLVDPPCSVANDYICMYSEPFELTITHVGQFIWWPLLKGCVVLAVVTTAVVSIQDLSGRNNPSATVRMTSLARYSSQRASILA